MEGDDIVRRIRVTIGGTEYTLRGREPEERIRAVAKMVDDVMQTVSDANPNLDKKRVAVLSALNLADELHKLRDQYEALLSLLDERTRV